MSDIISEPGQLLNLIVAEQARHRVAGSASPLICAIDGRSGSGKSTLTNTLIERLGADLAVADFRLDDMYQGWEGLAPALAHWQTMSSRLLAGQDTGPWWGWDWAENHPTGPHPFPSLQGVEVLLVEGVGALSGSHHLGVWVELPDHLRKERALSRDGQTYRPYWDTWARQEENWLSTHRRTYSRPKRIYRQN